MNEYWDTWKPSFVLESRVLIQAVIHEFLYVPWTAGLQRFSKVGEHVASYMNRKVQIVQLLGIHSLYL